MSRYADAFMTKVLEQIKYKKIHSTISRELNNHISELAGSYMEEGMEEEQAYDRAVEQMGDPVEIGRRLHKTHRPKIEWSIVGLLAALVIFGLHIIFVYSSYYDDYTYFNRQLFFMGIGIAVLIFCCYFDYKRLERYCFPGYIAAYLAVFITIIHNQKHFARSYIEISGFNFRASYAVIPLLLLCYAGFIKRWCDGKPANIIKLLGLAVLPLFFILLEPTKAYIFVLGTGLLAMLTFGILGKAFKANKVKTLLILYGGLLAAVLLLYMRLVGISPYIKRFAVFLDPYKDPLGAGWQAVQVDKVKDSAKLLGAGSYFENKGVSFLPGTDSDFIFTFVVGKLGWLFGILLIGLLAAVIIRLFMASWKVRDAFGKYLCLGICCVFSMQVIVNILISMGLFPPTSVPLPFFSYGGGNYLLNMALMGLLLGVYRRKDIIPDLDRISY